MSEREARTLDVTAVITGVMLGAASRIVDLLGARWIGDAAALWLLAAFLIGTRSPEPRRGATSGLSCLVMATFTYYGWRATIDANISNRYLMTVGVFWLISAIVLGAAAGWTGSRSRNEPRFWGLPAGAFLGEAVAIALLRQRLVQVVLELLATALLVSRTRRQAPAGILLALIVGGLIAVIALLYRPVFHQA